ncbi:hypothetical protein ACQKOH_09550 [Sphingomonas sp. NPDC092331]|uniref:hypothetical protein n=1 Tax=unclassified Sphingomonas TaxID=196159 RepID=UPI0029F42BCD|nr:hypothetical protein [Pseudomonadota bacterium]
MTGFLFAIGLAVLAGWMATLWLDRRQRAQAGQRLGLSADDFARSLAERGFAPEIAHCVHALVRPYYARGIAPHPDDSFADFLSIDAEEIEFMAAHAFKTLGIPEPSLRNPVRLPEIVTVADFAAALQPHRAGLAIEPLHH